MALLTAIVSGLFLVAVALAGWLWRRYKAEKDKREQLEDRIEEIDGRVDTIWYWAYGREDDSTDSGIADDVASGFEEVNERLERIENRVETLEDALVDSESIEDVERDDINH